MNWIKEGLDKLIALVAEGVKFLSNISTAMELIIAAGGIEEVEDNTPSTGISTIDTNPVVNGAVSDYGPNGRTKALTQVSREELLIGCKSYGINVPPWTRNATLIKWLKEAEAQEVEALPSLPPPTEAPAKAEDKKYTEEEVRETLMGCFRTQLTKTGIDEGKAMAICLGILVEKGNGVEEVSKLDPQYYAAVVAACNEEGVE